jgi:phosphohistidine phosphatase
MKLYLVQHGDAVAKDIDPERPLSDRGQQDVRAMAGFLRQAGVRARCVQHSGKRRAEQTAATLAAAVLMEGRPRAVPGIAPNDDVGVFASSIADWTQDTLVVGHLPFMARLVALLLTGDAERERVCYRPGTVVCLERSEASGWCLSWMLGPELLVAAARD